MRDIRPDLRERLETIARERASDGHPAGQRPDRMGSQDPNSDGGRDVGDSRQSSFHR